MLETTHNPASVLSAYFVRTTCQYFILWCLFPHHQTKIKLF